MLDISKNLVLTSKLIKTLSEEGYEVEKVEVSKTVSIWLKNWDDELELEQVFDKFYVMDSLRTSSIDWVKSREPRMKDIMFNRSFTLGFNRAVKAGNPKKYLLNWIEKTKRDYHWERRDI